MEGQAWNERRKDIMGTKRCRVILALVVAMCAIEGRQPALAQTSDAKVPVFGPGIHNGVLREAELSISYAISIPKGYSASEAVPLVLALHYGGSPNRAGHGVLSILVAPAFSALGAIIVAPDSVGGPWSEPENERAVNALLDAVQASYRIDKRRVAVTGFSMGGAGVWHFAGKYPERFSAAIPVAGRPSAAAAGWR